MTSDKGKTYNVVSRRRGLDGKPYIGIFGRRNNGKSSFINVLTGQDIAIVSDQSGTTTDPVKKSIEIFGIGPAVIIDTAGIDDSGELGLMRVQKSMDIIKRIDCAILLIAGNSFGEHENNLISEFSNYDIPFLIVHNKADIQPVSPEMKVKLENDFNCQVIDFSTLFPSNLDQVIESLRRLIPDSAFKMQSLLKGLICPGDYVLLITPIDHEAPEGRMILPQQMAIRDVLENNCICIVLKETEMEYFFHSFPIKPRIAVTDSQVFEKAGKIVPEDISLTSFSIVFARLKGAFEKYLEGTPKINELKDNDCVLILESCTHQINCDDIGRYKLPNWLKSFTGKSLDFDIVSGLTAIPRDITDYSLVIQCGGCMITRKQISSRLKPFIEAGIPVTNYGMAIAWMNGIFERATRMFTQSALPSQDQYRPQIVQEEA